MSVSFKTLPQTCLVLSLSVTSELKLRCKDRNILNIHNVPLQTWVKASSSLRCTSTSVLHSSSTFPFPYSQQLTSIFILYSNQKLIPEQSLAYLFHFLSNLKFLWHLTLGSTHSCLKHNLPLAFDITSTWSFLSLIFCVCNSSICSFFWLVF